MRAVVKLGGSLQESPTLKGVCEKIVDLSKNHQLVIVPGGGKFANQVRAFQEKQNLSDETADSMALLGMEIYGYALGELMTGIENTKNLNDNPTESKILLPFDPISKECDLEKSWRVTSDSLAAWICGRLGFENLLLVKRVDGIPVSDPRQDITTNRLREMKQSVVDPEFPDIMERNGLTAWIVNGEYPDRIKELIEGQEITSTKIVPRRYP